MEEENFSVLIGKLIESQSDEFRCDRQFGRFGLLTEMYWEGVQREMFTVCPEKIGAEIARDLIEIGESVIDLARCVAKRNDAQPDILSDIVCPLLTAENPEADSTDAAGHAGI
jgi:hypothetical protein